MGALREWLAFISDSWAVITGPIGFLVALGGVRIQAWWQRGQRLRALQRVATEEAIALCVRIGGQSDPLPDVKAYLQKYQPRIRKVLVYSATSDTLGDPATAERIIEDLREVIVHYGQERLTELHLFVAGMVAYPLVLGALLSNWCPIVVYHMRGSGEYVPLYRLTKEWLQRSKRTTRALSSVQVHEIT